MHLLSPFFLVLSDADDRSPTPTTRSPYYKESEGTHTHTFLAMVCLFVLAMVAPSRVASSLCSLFLRVAVVVAAAVSAVV